MMISHVAVGGCVSGEKKSLQVSPDPVAISVGADDGYQLRTIGEDWENGEPMVRQEVKLLPDGTELRHGKRTTYWENGQKKLEMHFVDDVPNGPKETWYIDGANWSRGSYVDGREDGTWETWYSTGQKQRESHMKNGAMDGMQTTWFFDGRKRSEGLWVNGKQTGVFTIWDGEGNIVEFIDYGQQAKE
jgi:antitoxin component YwqK of YwqJK toxin-antitoxin module